MGIIILVFSSFLLTSCTSWQSSSPPEWYYSLSKEGIRFGYGEDNDLKVSLAKAKADLAISLKSTIQAQKTYRSESLIVESNLIQKEQFFENINEYSELVLDNVELYKKEQKGKIYYVAVSLDLRNIKQKIADVFQKQDDHCLDSSYLSKSSIGKILTTSLTCKNHLGFAKLGDKKYIQLFNEVIYLKESDFLFFLPESTESISVKPDFKKLKNRSSLFFNLNLQSDGYITLINIFNNGSSKLLLENLYLPKGDDIEIPKGRFINVEKMFNDSRVEYEAYLFLFSKEKISTKNLNLASSSDDFEMLLKEISKYHSTFSILTIE